MEVQCSYLGQAKGKTEEESCNCRKTEFDPRKFLKPAMVAMEKVAKLRYEQFNTAGQVPKIKTRSLEEMASDYRSGFLDRN